jgi:hypothetical protein
MQVRTGEPSHATAEDAAAKAAHESPSEPPTEKVAQPMPIMPRLSFTR